jgi:tRNA A37 methylthiotransferase MiaB
MNEEHTTVFDSNQIAVYDQKASVYLETLACERRLIDTEKIRSYLMKNNYTIVDNPNEAQFIVLVTCGFTNAVANECFKKIDKYKTYDAKLIVGGCIPETHGEKLREFFDGDTISTKNLEHIDDIFPGNDIKFTSIEDVNAMLRNSRYHSIYDYAKYLLEQFRFTRKISSFLINHAFLKITGQLIYKTFPFNRLLVEKSCFYILISRGCIHNCSYCIIRKAIGQLKSKSIDQCYKEFNIGLDQGYKTFILEADDVGPYGIDIGKTLPELLRKLTSIDGHYSIELRNTHPYWLLKYQDELKEIVKSKKISSIFFSIQSGSDRILQLMRRNYTSNEIKNLIQSFKEIDPDIKIGVDMLVGFPSETIDDFHETLSLFNRISLDFGDIIPFSCHKDTEASTLEPKISDKEKKERIKEALKFLRKKDYFALINRNHGSISFYAR